MSNQELQKVDSENLQVQSIKPNELLGNWITNKEHYEISLTYSEKKIGRFNSEEMGDIVDVLAQWRLMLGVTSDTTQEELVFITQFLYDNYKHLTLPDLKMAKNWSIMGRVDVGHEGMLPCQGASFSAFWSYVHTTVCALLSPPFQ